MNQYEVSPKGKVGTISLLILTWFTISPLMWIINKRGKVLRANQVFWLNVFSPFTGTVLSLLFLIYDLPYLTHFLPSLADSLRLLSSGLAAYLCWHLEIKASPFVNRLFKRCGFMLKPLKRVLKTEFRQE